MATSTAEFNEADVPDLSDTRMKRQELRNAETQKGAGEAAI
jgi:hypothetical protein